MKQCSILNDVIGPVMTGPSSSHTAGCTRIGLMARTLYGRPIQKADVIFDARGSYPNTYIGQGTDFGFTGGLLGLRPDDATLKNAVQTAQKSGVEICFKKSDLGAHHPNEARIDIKNQNGEIEMTVRTYSTGGGMFSIVEMDGFPVKIQGERKQVFIACQKGEAEQKVLAQLGTIPTTHCVRDETILFEVEDGEQISCDTVAKIETIPGVLFVRTAEILLPVALRTDGHAPFSTAEEAAVYNIEKKRSLWELALEYECGVGRISREEIWEQMYAILKVMRDSSVIRDRSQAPVTGILRPTAALMENHTSGIADIGVLQQSMLRAVAVMESSCAREVIVAAPTAGSSGVLPATVVAIGEQMRLSDEEIVKGLLAAGLVGVFIANQATFGAEVAACQAENGAASAMASAGMVQLLGGDAKMGFAAAALSLQNLLGLVCDPVAGLTEIPCISRNVVAAANAVVSANMVLCGYDPVIPLDETILSMLEVGKMLPGELRCTCGGGLCATKTGRRLENQIKCAAKGI